MKCVNLHPAQTGKACDPINSSTTMRSGTTDGFLVTAANFKDNYSLHALTALCNTTKVNIIHDDYIRLHQNKSEDRLATRPTPRKDGHRPSRLLLSVLGFIIIWMETQTTNQWQCDHGRWLEAKVEQQHRKGPDRLLRMMLIALITINPEN